MLYDPELDCGATPSVQGGLGAASLLGATVWQERALLFEKGGLAFEFIAE